MKCRRCNHPSTRVVETRVQEDGITKRRRACEDCDFRFNSYEIPPEALSAVRSRLEEWRRSLTSSHALKRRLGFTMGDRAKEHFRQGKTIEQVAAHFKVSTYLAQEWSKRYRTTEVAEQKESFKRDVLRGLSNAELAQKYGWSLREAKARKYRLKRAFRRHSGDVQPHHGDDDER